MKSARSFLVLRMTMVATAAAVILCFTGPSAIASPALRQAPQNPAFKLQASGAGAALRAGAGAALRAGAAVRLHAAAGLAPAPVDIGTLAGASPARVAVSLPTSYDLRSIVPARLSPIEDQGSDGTCWAFASLGSLESVLWSAFPSETPLFSEDNLVLNSGFFADLDAADLYQVGGNSLMATAYLARWAGPVPLAQDAYGDHATPSGLTATRHVQDVLYIPRRRSSTDNDAVKAAIMEYGAVYVTFSWDAAYWRNDARAYFCPTSLMPNHAVDIVGWDDEYPASDFSVRPPGNGAFIVRNSWGTGWGDGGYFYLSYYDATLALEDVSDLDDGNAVFVAAQPVDDYDTNYQYDKLGWTTSIGFSGSSTGWFANRFTATADGALKAVSFYAATPSSTYVVYEGQSLSSLSEVGSGTLALAGYHTVDLDSSPALTLGAKFVVAVKLSTPDYDYPIPAEYAWTEFYGYSAAATASTGQSYVSADGSAWTDLVTMSGYANTNVCLKAFAADAVPVDAAPPATTVSGAVGGWHRKAVTLTFAARDGAVGSGVARTEYRVDHAGDFAWTTGTSVTLSAPGDHSGDGVHTVEYRSVDNSGNTESAHSCTVKIDTRKPRPLANWAVRVVRGHRATVRIYIRDSRPGSSRATAVIRVRSATGRLRQTIVVRGRVNSLAPRPLRVPTGEGPLPVHRVGGRRCR